MNKEIKNKIQVCVLRDVEIQMYRLQESGQIVSFENIKEILVSLEGLYTIQSKEKKEPTCEYGHQCTSRCQNDTDCPCVNEHWCSMSDEHSPKDCTDSDEECPQHPKPDLADLINDELNEK